MPERRWPRGVTPRPRTGAVAESARLRRRRNCQEKLLHVRGWGGGLEELPTSEAKGSGRKEQPHLQGAVAARAQEGLEELFHIQRQKGHR